MYCVCIVISLLFRHAAFVRNKSIMIKALMEDTSCSNYHHKRFWFVDIDTKWYTNISVRPKTNTSEVTTLWRDRNVYIVISVISISIIIITREQNETLMNIESNIQFIFQDLFNAKHRSKILSRARARRRHPNLLLKSCLVDWHTTDDLEWPWMAVSLIARYLCG